MSIISLYNAYLFRGIEDDLDLEKSARNRLNWIRECAKEEMIDHYMKRFQDPLIHSRVYRNTK